MASETKISLFSSDLKMFWLKI